MIEDVLRKDIVIIGKKLYEKNMVASNDGNISVKINDNEVLITPTGVSKGELTESQLLKVDMAGNLIEGYMKPTSEMKMHLSVYQNRKDINAVVHAHPQKATAFAVANLCLDQISLPEVIFSIGKVSIAEYGTPSTDQIPNAVKKHIAHSDAILLANHGALTIGEDLTDAYYKMETLEHFAAITIYSRILGGERFLDDSEKDELYKVREKVFGKSNKTFCDNCNECSSSNAVNSNMDSTINCEKDLIENIVNKVLEKFNGG